jgi:tetratricopeptide repeat protein 21B
MWFSALLLQELPQNPKSPKTRVLECYAMMAAKQKPEIEKAINALTDILNNEKDYMPALLVSQNRMK